MTIQECKEKSLIIEEISQNPSLLENKHLQWSCDRSVVEAAIKTNWRVIRYTPLYQADKELGLVAVSQNGLAKYLLSKELRKDPEIKQIAASKLPKSNPGNYTKRNIVLIHYDECPISQQLKNLGGYNNQILEVPGDSRYADFLRDPLVTRFNGGFLIPYSFKKLEFLDFIQFMLPSDYIDKLKKPNGTIGLYGSGILKRHTNYAMLRACELKLPFIPAETCIEGGNCFLFISNQGKKKAIVGVFSLYLSMFALEEKGAFHALSIEDNFKPSLDSIRIASEFANYKTTRQRNYKYQISNEDELKYYNDAVKIDAQINYTKNKIAE